MVEPSDKPTPQRSKKTSEVFKPERHAWLFVVAVILVAFVAVWPAVSQPGLLNTRGGGDSPFLLQRLQQLVTAVSEGHFPARWMPDANYGYGYPFYNFYAPLSIYIAGAFRALGFSFVRSIHLAHVAGFVAAGLGMFALGRNWLGSRWAGLLAAAAYTVAPFHMVNVYVRGDSLAEFWAMAFYPLVLLAADGVLDATPALRWRRIALFGLAYAALILSHNISALIFTPFLLLYLVLRWFWPRPAATALDEEARKHIQWAAAVWPLLGLGLALALAAWFFVPALAEQNLAQLGPVTEGYFNYTNHFRGLDLIQPTILFDYSPDGGAAFHMGLVQAIMATLGGVILFVYTVRSRVEATARPERLVFIGLAALVATFMITPLSRPLWDHLPLLSFTQFPWRFLSVQALATALLTAGLSWPAGRQAIVPAAALILLLGGLLGLRTDHLILTDADVTAEKLAQYEWFTGNIGTTVSAEYLPPGVVPRPYSSDWLNSGERQRPSVVDGRLISAELLMQETGYQKWQFVTGDAGASIMLPTLYWPGWAATSDTPVNLTVQPGSGLIRLDLPAGQHEVELLLGRTPVRRAAEWVSLIALFTVAGLLFIGRRPREVSQWLLAIGGVALLLVGGAWLLRQSDPQSLPPDDLTWDFAQMAYLHHDTSGVPFQDGSQLFSYGYSHDEIRAGEMLTVTLSMAPGAAPTATLDLVTPALARPVPRGQAEPPILASQDVPLDGDSVVFSLLIPSPAPTGLYVPRLTIDDARPLMPSGQTRGDLFLRPVRILPPAGRPAINTLPLGGDSLAADVRADAIFAAGDRALEGHFTWLVDRPPGQNYKVSWRVQDGNGAVLAQLDTQPGYGFNPTVSWPARVPVPDRLTLQLPETLVGQPPYPLVMLLYDPVTSEPVMLRRLGELVEQGGQMVYQPITPVFTPPERITPSSVSLSEGGRPLVSLHGYELDDSGDALEITFYWEALADMPIDYLRFVHLIDTATGDTVAQVDGHPAGNSYPTSQWLAAEVVADRVLFDTTAVPPGTYQIAAGFYRPDGERPRLDVTGADGLLPDGRILIPDLITLP